MKTCEDVMTPDPVCCLPTHNAREVAGIMKRENIGPLPVIDNEENQKLIGIITDRDLVLKILANGSDAESAKVETIMTRKVVTCRPDDPLHKALRAMSEHQLRRIIVVDHVYKVLGIISQADVAIRVNQAEKTAQVVKEISQPNLN